MNRYEPTFDLKETSANVLDFVNRNMDQVWKIYKPLMPHIVILSLIDAMISDIYMPHSETGFALGGLVSTYFIMAFSISWYRLVIQGSDNFEAMNPFKPRRSELKMVGVMVLILVVLVVVAFIGGTLAGVSALMGGGVAGIIAGLLACGLIIAYFIWLFRLTFFFPAIAVGHDISLREATSLTKGYVWKFMNVSAIASLRVLVMMIVALVAMSGMMVLLIQTGIPLQFLAIETMPNIVGFIIAFPILVYFQPILIAIISTAIANYYLYAIRRHG